VLVDSVQDNARGNTPSNVFVLPPRTSKPTSASPGRTHRRIMDAISSNSPGDYPPAYAAGIMEHCGQLREFRDRHGIVSEPLWKACLGLLAFCEDGEALAHDISKGDSRYDFGETQGRLERYREFGPSKCTQFHACNSETCEACPLWGKITSPIVKGWRPVPVPDGGPAEAREITQWEYTAKGALKPNSYANTVMALRKLNLKCSHDIFHNRKIIEGDVVENLGPELSDAACREIRDRIVALCGVDPGKQNVQEAVEHACEKNRFDPVVDYLDALQWDRQPRLDRWLIDYLGAGDTPLNRAIGRKMLIAAVRRVRQPGCKFDYMPVLEGKQGTGKSTSLRILAGDDNFSDQPLLHLDTRAQQEAHEGTWIHEISELNGLRRTEVETVKSFISKMEDNARPAYGRFLIHQRRRGILVGTTNDSEYLRDSTGNRRFWPVKTGTIDLVALRHDRDQLWAEAAAAEKTGEALTLPPELYAAAAEQQERRLMKDGWEDLLADVKGNVVNVDGTSFVERISSLYLLKSALGLPADRITDVATKRLATVMHRPGWQGPKKMKFEAEAWDQGLGKQAKKSTPLQGYWRPAGADQG
jgi:hypothetical protein